MLLGCRGRVLKKACGQERWRIASAKPSRLDLAFLAHHGLLHVHATFQNLQVIKFRCNFFYEKACWNVPDMFDEVYTRSYL